MTKDLAEALKKLEASRAVLRGHLLAREDQNGAETGGQGAATTDRARRLAQSVEAMWHGSTLSHIIDLTRPVVVQAIRESPFAALAVAAGLGAAMGFSPGLRRGVLHTVAGVLRKSIDTATLLTLLWQVYSQPAASAPAAEKQPDAGEAA